MSLKQDIQAAVKEAMKAKDNATLTVLRGAIATMNAKQTEKRYKISKEAPDKTEEVLAKESELTDEEMLDALSSEVKKRRDAIALFEQGGRAELAESEKAEIAILQKYLPEQLSVEELRKLVAASIEKTGAKEVKDMGKVMADLQSAIKGKADGKEVSMIVKELLGK